MRYKGRQLKGPKIETLAIPRPPTKVLEKKGEDGEADTYREESNDIIFQAQAVMDFDEFEILCPPPIPPKMLKPGGVTSVNTDSPEFKIAMNEWATKKRDWLILKSLSVTPDLEWEMVKLDDPDTYSLYAQELKDAGFNHAEVMLISSLAMKVNSVDEDKMEEARQRFLEDQAARLQQTLS